MVIYLQRLKEFLIWGEAFPGIGYRISRQLECNGICISLYRIPTYNHFTVYLWLPHDLAEVIKLIGETFRAKIFLLSFHPIFVIPSEYCHAFRIIAISNICHPEQLQYPPIPEGRENWPAHIYKLNVNSTVRLQWKVGHM